jgi:hypothetical protein
MAITPLVPTYNCESTIRECLGAVSWIDEILIVDSFSTDRTWTFAASIPIGKRIWRAEILERMAEKGCDLYPDWQYDSFAPRKDVDPTARSMSALRD